MAGVYKIGVISQKTGLGGWRPRAAREARRVAARVAEAAGPAIHYFARRL